MYLQPPSKYLFSLNGEYVTEKEFRKAYGDEFVKQIKSELKESSQYTTIYLNDGLDEVTTR